MRKSFTIIATAMLASTFFTATASASLGICYLEPPPRRCVSVLKGDPGPKGEWQQAVVGYIQDLREGTDPGVVIPLMFEAATKADETEGLGQYGQGVLELLLVDAHELGRAVVRYYSRTMEEWIVASQDRSDIYGGDAMRAVAHDTAKMQEVLRATYSAYVGYLAALSEVKARTQHGTTM